MFHSIKLKPLLTSLALPLAAGGLSAALAGDIRAVYDSLLQPPLAPPGPVFPVVWTTLSHVCIAANRIMLRHTKSGAKMVIKQIRLRLKLIVVSDMLRNLHLLRI